MKGELRWNKWEWAKNIKGINNSLKVSLREVKSNVKEAKINFFCKTSDQKEGVNQALMSRPRVSLGYLNLKVSSQGSTLVACMKSLTGTGKKQAIGLPVLRALPGLFSSSSSFPEILLPHSGPSLHLNFCFCLFSHLHPQSFPFTFFEFFKNFYWLIWAALGLHSVQGPSLVAVKLRGVGFLFTVLSSPVVECGLWDAPASGVVVVGPRSWAACGVFLNQGLILCPLNSQADSLPLDDQGSPSSVLSANKRKGNYSIQFLYRIYYYRFFQRQLYSSFKKENSWIAAM